MSTPTSYSKEVKRGLLAYGVDDHTNHDQERMTMSIRPQHEPKQQTPIVVSTECKMEEKECTTLSGS